MTLIARTTMGGRDLFHGCPNLKGATIEDVLYPECEDNYYYQTELVIKDKQGLTHKIIIRQER